MKIDHPGRFPMPRRTLLELPAGHWQVGSGGGTLWLTLDEDPRDIVLEPGERWTVQPGERALVYALDDAVLELRPQAAPARAARPLVGKPLVRLLQPA